ncbi:sortase [Sphingorhabdus arenilitoris]|uniref:Sortase n=1 Tax=Sphingorhabdus arenilitoris TaxID=1490041 RepID=A0ABV8RM38_9SPHN
MKNSTRKITLAVSIALCTSGLAVAASGAAVPIKAKVAQVLLENAYAETVKSGELQSPWMGADIAPIGKITMPRLGVSEIILNAGSVEAMRAGPTLVPGSADIGAPGTSVIAAHRDTHFAFLKDVQVGDIFQVAGRDGVMMPYRVTSMKVVHADRFTVETGMTQNELALSTCYPFGSVRGGKQRYVVRAVLDASQMADIGPAVIG